MWFRPVIYVVTTKMSISRLLWGDRWKLHGEIQRHAIVIRCLWQVTDVRIVSCRSTDFDMFQITYKCNSVSSENFRLLKFPWKKVQRSESGWYTMDDVHDLRFMFVVTSSCPPRRLVNFFKRWQTEARFLFRILLIRSHSFKASHVSFVWNVCCWEH